MGKTNLASNLGANVIINPSHDYWQRESSFGSVASGIYSSDRWMIARDTRLTSVDINRIGFAAPWSNSQYCMRITNQVADAALTDGYLNMWQKIEGYNFRKVINGDMVLAFDAYSSIGGIHSIQLQSPINNRRIILDYSLEANTWTRVLLKIPKMPDAYKASFGKINDVGVHFAFVLRSGTDFTTDIEGWGTYSKTGRVGQADIGSVAGAFFQFGDVSLTEGSDEHPFDELRRDPMVELQLCQRYFEKSYNLGDAIGANTGTPQCYGLMPDATYGYATRVFPFHVQKRTIPVVVSYEPVTGAAGYMRRTDGTAYTMTPIGIEHAVIFDRTGLVIGWRYYFHWTADAEL